MQRIFRGTEMNMRIFISALLVTTGLSACSLGGSSESVVGSINTSPVILNTNLNVQVTENESALAFTVSAIDANFERLSLTISGTDADDFAHPGGGEIVFVSGPDFEAPTDANTDNVYEITITVSDGPNSDSKNFVITVVDDPSDNPVTKAQCNPIGTSDVYQSCVISSGGLDRAFSLFVPTSYGSQAEAVPLVFSFHGDNETAQTNIDYSGFQPLAEKSGFLVAYPQGSVLNTTGQTHWDVEGTNDVAFIGAVSDYLSESYKIDANRIFAAGMGAGGTMSHKLACSDSGRFAAIGSVASAFNPASCAPSQAMPTIHIHGKLDGVVPYAGSALNLPIDNMVGFWGQANGCAGTGAVTSMPDITGDIMGGTYTSFGGCDAAVSYYVMDGMGHVWPDGVNADLNAAERIWGFFSGVGR